MTDVLTINDLITDKKHSTFFAEVVTGKTGGLSTGADISTSTNQVTGQVQKTLPQVLADLGMVVQTWTATSGGTLTNAAQVFLNDKVGSAGLGNYYAWSGTFPKVITAGLDPAITAGFIQRSEAGLRSELAANTGAQLVKMSSGISVEASLALKANTTDVNSALALKANTTDVNSALSAKADINSTKKGGLTQSILANALTLNYASRLLQFRNSTLTDGTAVGVTPSAAMGLTVPSGATLGGSSGVPMEVLVLGILNGGSPVIGVVNANGGLILDESGLISTTAISASATSSAVVYSSVAVTNSPYIILNRLSVTLPTAGAWSVLPTVTPLDLIGSSMLLRKIQSLPLPTTSGTSINVTGIPSWAKRISIIFDDVKTSSASEILVQVGSSSIITTGYTSSSVSATTGSGTLIQTATAGFVVFNTIAGMMLDGKMWLDILHNSVIEEHLVSVKGVSAVLLGGGKLALTGGVTQLVLTTGEGNVGFSGGAITLVYEG